MPLTRGRQQAGTIYVLPGNEGAFFTPDGEGRIWFESAQDAQREVEYERMLYLSDPPEDD